MTPREKRWKEFYELYTAGRCAGKTTAMENAIQDAMVFGEGHVRIVADPLCPPNQAFILDDGKIQKRNGYSPIAFPTYGHSPVDDITREAVKKYAQKLEREIITQLQGEKMDKQQKQLDIIVNQGENGYIVRENLPGAYNVKTWVARNEKELGDLVVALAKKTEIKIQQVR